MNTTLIGNVGEDIAVDYLQKSGYTVLERNGVYAGCEIDVICEAYVDSLNNVVKKKLFSKQKGERTLVFCEVKARSQDIDSAAEAVTPYKAGRYVQAAKEYVSTKRLNNFAVRFDMILIAGEQFEHIVDAFNSNDAKYSKRR